jgi:hypothetical protein
MSRVGNPPADEKENSILLARRPEQEQLEAWKRGAAFRTDIRPPVPRSALKARWEKAVGVYHPGRGEEVSD